MDVSPQRVGQIGAPARSCTEAGPSPATSSRLSGGGRSELPETFQFNAGAGRGVQVLDVNGQASADAVRAWCRGEPPLADEVRWERRPEMDRGRA